MDDNTNAVRRAACAAALYDAGGRTWAQVAQLTGHKSGDNAQLAAKRHHQRVADMEAGRRDAAELLLKGGAK